MMRHENVPWAVPGRSPLSFNSGSSGVMTHVADYTTRAIVWPCTPKGRIHGPAAPRRVAARSLVQNLETKRSPNLGTPPHPRSSAAHFLRPLESLNSLHVVRQPGLAFEQDGETHEIPRYQFSGPPGGDDPVRIGVFATIHGDEPESGLGLIRFLQALAEQPEAGQGFLIQAYPLCNPTGYENATRHSRNGKDLNREFWRNSREPEIRLLEHELSRHQFHGIIALHCDDTSHGLYGFLSGRQPSAVLSASLLKPALSAAEKFLPRNSNPEIDGFHARRGVLSSCYEGVLCAPNSQSHSPFEITFETPQLAPVGLQIEAFEAALFSILAEFRLLRAIGQNI